MKKLICTTLGMLVIVFAVCATLAYMYLPDIAGKFIQTAVRENVQNGSFTYKSISVDPVTFQLKIQDGRLKGTFSDADVTTEFAQFDVSINPMALLKKEIEIRNLTLEKPVAVVSYALGKKKAKKEKKRPVKPTQEKDSPESSYDWSVNRLRLENGTFVFRDTSLKKPSDIRLDAIRLTVDQLSNKDKDATVDFSANTLKGRVSCQAACNPVKESINGTFGLNQLNLTVLNPIIGQRTARELSGGLVNAKGNIQTAKTIRVDTDARIEKLGISEKGKTVISLNEIVLSGIHYDTKTPDALRIAELKTTLLGKKSTKVVNQVFGLLGSIMRSIGPGAVADGVESIGKLNTLTFKDIVYENGEFSYKGPMDSLGKTVLDALDAVFGNLVSLVLP